MSRKTPPPLPNQELDNYQKIADKVGFVPSLRVKDNVIQGITAVIGAGIGVLVGYLIAAHIQSGATGIAMMVGGLLGFITGALLVGFVLMILGWFRK
ncbi:MAG: hypothetical protein IPK69_01620 [Phycisphaerales bacterium]|nr:MAG: hypothetical protein IPK69_01620 [Phycisphaerales bacterium]